MYLLDSSYVIPELSMQMITKTEGRLHICDAYSLVLMADSGMHLAVCVLPMNSAGSHPRH